MKAYKILLLLICLSCILTSCNQNADDEKSQAGHELPEELNVWIVADKVTEYYRSENREEAYYTSMISVGDFDSTTTTYGEKGYMFYDALKQYQKETGITLNIEWFGQAYLLEEKLEKGNEVEQPDLIITSYVSSTADYYRYMDEGYFYDLTKYFDEHEMYTGNQYYNQVLKAGEHDKKQYMMPILFNVDTIMGSKEIWDEIGLYLNDINRHSDLLDALIYAQQQDEIDQVACQFVSGLAKSLPEYIYNASGEEWINYDNWTVNVDENTFRKVGVFYKQLLEEQFDDELVQGENIPWEKSKYFALITSMVNDIQLDTYIKDIGCFIEGGGARQSVLHSAAAQAWYYESRYRDMEMDFEIYAMPGIDGGTMGHVSYMGAVLSSSEYPEASFDFLKYIMDREVPVFFGLSVNRENTANQLDYMSSTAYYLRPGFQHRMEDGTLMDSEADYLIQPMSEETKEKLEVIIEDMETVSLPNWPVYSVLDAQLERYAKEKCTIEEAYQEAIEELSLYAKGK